MTTADGSTLASVATVHQQVAAALNDGLPLPIAIDMTPRPRALHVHVHNRADWDEWRRWWNRQGAGPWQTMQEPHKSTVHHRTVGWWRGWDLTIVHVTGVEL